MKTFGLALGGGGVRGLAHALVLEALDEMGCRPSIIAGTSIGAIIGALYASGVSGQTIRKKIQKNIISRRDSWRDIFKKRSDLLKVVQTVAFERGPSGIVKPDLFLNFLLSSVHKQTFEELDIPLLVIATDYWKGEEVVLESGELLPALKASIAIPGVFAPVTIDDRVLLDGGIVNIVPYEHILGRCDVSIAVDVACTRTPGKNRMPNFWDLVLGSLQLMQEVTLSDKMKHRRPDILVHPKITDIPMLAFGKAAQVLRQSAPTIKEMKNNIEEILARS
ncbi:MAG: patatin-like phospholipase family protein [Kiritimatiellae bacterium]|nr:patatin-like phospholipase family protein [Kiritimatiellia bacterium]MDD5519938.1 patatin-like phospholipase family protein [Kiritimatiellia bacterium]